MEESDVGAFGLFQAMIEVVDDPDIAAVADVPDPVVVERVHDRGGIVGGGIVRDDQFEILKRLGQDACDRIFEKSRALIRRDAHTHRRRLTHAPNPCGFTAASHTSTMADRQVNS